MGTQGARAVSPHTREVRAEAIRRFRAANAPLELPPVVTVVAAFDEAPTVGAVVREVPRRVCGLDVATLVVDDGSTDGTAAAAAAAGALVVRLERNCGQGVALRVGYELAREGGARFLVTLDGDGQWRPADVPTCLAPVVAGEADFVIGSRVLGANETGDAFRGAGALVFAALVRLLTRVQVTDTSSGLRAMRAEITAAVPQVQVQYQASELLIGVIAAGYRVAERPVVMRKRVAGHSKKGHDLLYGARYARVILVSWWRGRRRASRPA